MSVVEVFSRKDRLSNPRSQGKEKSSHHPRTNHPPSSVEEACRECEGAIFKIIDIEHDLYVRADLDDEAWERKEASYSMRKARKEFLFLWLLQEQSKKLDALAGQIVALREEVATIPRGKGKKRKLQAIL